MITILISIIVCFFLAWTLSDWDKLQNACFGAVGGLFLGIILTIIIGLFFETTTEVYSSERIYALQDNNSITGSFFLGSGSVEGDIKYYYLVAEDGGKFMKSVSADEVIIHDDVSSDSARIDNHRAVFKNKNNMRWGMPMTLAKNHIYIPSGAIKYNYNVDLQ